MYRLRTFVLSIVHLLSDLQLGFLLHSAKLFQISIAKTAVISSHVISPHPPRAPRVRVLVVEERAGGEIARLEEHTILQAILQAELQAVRTYLGPPPDAAEFCHERIKWKERHLDF